MRAVRRVVGFVGAAAVFVVAVEVLWSPPAGIIAHGALLGGLTSLLAIGIALVYRAHRIVNFVAGDSDFMTWSAVRFSM